MKFTVEIFGRKFNYDMTLDQLIGEYATTQLGYIDNDISDGNRDNPPSRDGFISDMYRDIVTGSPCEIMLDDGIGFNMVFPESVRFETTTGIKEIIGKEYDKYF